MKEKIAQLRVHLRDPLYRNGYALMANTAITSLFGFGFWILADHIYSAAEVGRAFAQISAMMLISALTQLNFTSVLLRFLPRAGRQTMRLISTAYVISVVFAAIIATVFVVTTRAITSPTSALHMTPEFGICFVLATSAWSIFNLQDGVLTGLRQTIWVPVENGSFNIGKVVLLFALQPVMGPNGIFAATVIPVVIASLPVNFVIFSRFAARNVEATLDRSEPLQFSTIGKYIAGDYISTLFGQSMTTLMPVLVASVLGNTANGYFSSAQTMGMALDLVAFNLAQSLTVEASGDEDRARQMTIDIARRVATIVLPLALFFFIAAPWILRIFGEQYSDHATGLLRLLVLSTIGKSVIAIHIAMARVNRKTQRNAATAALQATLLIGGSIILMRHIGINGVGWAAILAQTVVAIVVLPWMYRTLRHQGKHFRELARST